MAVVAHMHMHTRVGENELAKRDTERASTTLAYVLNIGNDAGILGHDHALGTRCRQAVQRTPA